MMIKSRLYSLPTVVLLLVLMPALMSCRHVSPLPEDADSLVPTPAGVVVYKGNINGEI